MNTKTNSVLTCFLLVLTVTLFTAQTGYSAEKTSLTKKKQNPKAARPTYKIGSGDVLDIITWKEVDFSREEVLVRIDGKITFPALNDVQAAGRTPMQLKKDLETRLKEYIDSPVVTVNVKVPNSQKFYILGEVVNTGEYHLNKNLTVLQAFALAGGFTEWAAKNEIILFRKENGKEKIIRVKYKHIIKGKDFSQNIQIIADDTIIVP